LIDFRVKTEFAQDVIGLILPRITFRINVQRAVLQQNEKENAIETILTIRQGTLKEVYADFS
jgi:hypothetical protein